MKHGFCDACFSGDYIIPVDEVAPPDPQLRLFEHDEPDASQSPTDFALHAPEDHACAARRFAVGVVAVADHQAIRGRDAERSAAREVGRRARASGARARSGSPDATTTSKRSDAPSARELRARPGSRRRARSCPPAARKRASSASSALRRASRSHFAGPRDHPLAHDRVELARVDPGALGGRARAGAAKGSPAGAGRVRAQLLVRVAEAAQRSHDAPQPNSASSAAIASFTGSAW